MFGIRSYKILNTFFVLEKLKSITFWPKLKFGYLNLRITFSLVSLIIMRVVDFHGLKAAIKYRRKNSFPIFLHLLQI